MSSKRFRKAPRRVERVKGPVYPFITSKRYSEKNAPVWIDEHTVLDLEDLTNLGENVPLTIHRNGERVVIGEAEMKQDGVIEGVITAHKFSSEIQGDVSGLSIAQEQVYNQRE